MVCSEVQRATASLGETRLGGHRPVFCSENATPTIFQPLASPELHLLKDGRANLVAATRRLPLCSGLEPVAQRASLRGIADDFIVYVIPEQRGRDEMSGAAAEAPDAAIFPCESDSAGPLWGSAQRLSGHHALSRARTVRSPSGWRLR
jgi:hypothetical protein